MAERGQRLPAQKKARLEEKPGRLPSVAAPPKGMRLGCTPVFFGKVQLSPESKVEALGRWGPQTQNPLSVLPGLSRSLFFPVQTLTDPETESPPV